MTAARPFEVKSSYSPWYMENGKCILKPVTTFKIVQYQTAGVDFPVEGTPIDGKWTTRAEAEAAAARVNAGDETGIHFASYADD